MIGSLTGLITNGSIVFVGQIGKIDCIRDVSRAQIGRFGCSMTATAQQTTACALQQSTRHPTDEKKLTSSTFVLTLEFTILNVPCVCSQNFRGIVCVWCETTVFWRGNGGSGGGGVSKFNFFLFYAALQLYM